MDNGLQNCAVTAAVKQHYTFPEKQNQSYAVSALCASARGVSVSAGAPQTNHPKRTPLASVQQNLEAATRPSQHLSLTYTTPALRLLTLCARSVYKCGSRVHAFGLKRGQLTRMWSENPHIHSGCHSEYERKGPMLAAAQTNRSIPRKPKDISEARLRSCQIRALQS